MYLTEAATPLKNARKASFDLMTALYDLAYVYHSNDDTKAAAEVVKARDLLAKVEAVIKKYDSAQTDELLKELQDTGII